MSSESNGGAAFPWEQAATNICKSVEERVAATARRAADEIYESVMATTQDYLRDNVDFNLSSQLQSLERTCGYLREEKQLLAGALADLVKALKDAECRLGGAGMLGGDSDPICSALSRFRELEKGNG